MPAPFVSYTRDERGYSIIEPSYGITPNASGVSALTGSNCFSLISLEMNPEVDLYDAEYKTGSRSIIPGQPGRKVGNFRLTMPLKGSGTPGVPSDYAPIMTSAFGVQYIVPGTSVVYKLVDNPATTFSLYRFRTPTQLFQQLGISCIPTRTVWNLGQNMANLTVEGQCMWVLDSEQFPSADSIARGGLTAFPGEPPVPVVNGLQAQGFVGNLYLDGQLLTNIQQMTVTADWGWSQNRTMFGSYYPTDVLGGTRRITCTMEAYDDTSSAMQDLRAKGINKASVQATAQIGNIPGNVHYLTIANLQLDFPQLIDSGDRFGLRWSNMVAHETTPGSADELVLTEA